MKPGCQGSSQVLAVPIPLGSHRGHLGCVGQDAQILGFPMQHPLLLSEAGGAQGLSFWSGWKTSLCFLQPRRPQHSGGEESARAPACTAVGCGVAAVPGGCRAGGFAGSARHSCPAFLHSWRRLGVWADSKASG